jgi:hypothetical protein
VRGQVAHDGLRAVAMVHVHVHDGYPGLPRLLFTHRSVLCVGYPCHATVLVASVSLLS